MIHSKLLDYITSQRSHGEFIYPYYGELSLAEFVPTVLDLFNIKSERKALPAEFYKSRSSKVRRVLTFFVDGLGYDQFLLYRDKMPFFDRLIRHGDLYPMTSIFPSTTAAGLTTVHTGLSPQEHGLPEWVVYFEEFKKMIETIPFRPLSGGSNDSLLNEGGKPEMLYQGETIYQKLKQNDVQSYVFVHQSYAEGAYSSVILKGAAVIPYMHGSDLFVRLRKLLLKEKGPAYFFVYWPEVDSTEHVFGPHSEEHIAELSVFCNLMENEFLSKLKKEDVNDVLMLLISDHGQTNVNPKETIFLESYPELMKGFIQDENGLRMPTGSPRDVFLSLQPEKIEEALRTLKKKLSGKAEVMTIQDALGRGLFGLNKATDRFMRRIGNVVILPYKDFTIWYNYKPGKPFAFLGHHGGLSKEEMIIPFGIARLAEMLKN